MQDKKYMNMCLTLAGKALGMTAPNPLVGALIVKNDKIISQGFHEQSGKDHAEAVALNLAGKKARGATLYVNLEPCCHYGKTPPCTEKIIKAKISRVVIAMKDPNPLVAGKSIKQLRDAGIVAEVGLLKKKAIKLNEIFIKYITTKRPFVTLKAAMSLDGRIATITGQSKWITSQKARNYVHKLRSQHDAILVGLGTVLKDNPRLSSRINSESSKNPIRIIADSGAKIPIDSNILKDLNNTRTIIAVTKKAIPGKIKKLTNMGTEVLLINSLEERVDLDDLFNKLGSMGITSILAEGGGELNASLIEQNLVDKLLIFIAPKIIGGKGAVSLVGGKGVANLKDAFKCGQPQIRRFGQDILLETYPLKGGEAG